MQITLRRVPQEVDQTVRDQVTKDITDALNSVTTVGGRFVVNDTPWFEVSGGKLKARVTNTAEYISQTFEDFLAANRGWKQQQMLEGQRIDAYLEIDHPAGSSTDKAALFSFLDEYTNEHPDEEPDTTAIRLYQMYVKRGYFDILTLSAKYNKHFRNAAVDRKFRVGLEFETGNIASSFRALTKLGFLYRRGHIDAGVFITSVDKANASARIWPPANRNGSFVELEARQYRDAIFFPIWEAGFAPDSFDRSAPYLGPKKTTYTLQNTSKKVKVGRYDYEVWKNGAKEILRRI